MTYTTQIVLVTAGVRRKEKKKEENRLWRTLNNDKIITPNDTKI